MVGVLQLLDVFLAQRTQVKWLNHLLSWRSSFAESCELAHYLTLVCQSKDSSENFRTPALEDTWSVPIK